VLSINHKIHALENEIAQLHRKHGILDKELLELDKNGVVESIEKKFSTSQDNFEFQIQKQRERLQQFSKEVRLYSKYLRWMETSAASSFSSSPSSKQLKGGTKKRKQQSMLIATGISTSTGAEAGAGVLPVGGVLGELPVDYHLEQVKQEVFKFSKLFLDELEKVVEAREKSRNAAALESDDAKDLLQEVQVKNKFLTQDLEKKRALLNTEMQGLLPCSYSSSFSCCSSCSLS
jgi:hypothetical protein